MKLTLKYIAIVLIGGSLALSSCSKHPDSPGYEYAPDMYRSQAIEAYVDYGLVGDDEKGETAERLRNTQSARVPADGTIPYFSNKDKAALNMPLEYGKADLDSASANLKMPESYLNDIGGNVKEGKRLYNIMCQHCHGKTGDGDGGVVTVGDYNTPSPYSGPYKGRSLGGIFHIVTYGKGAMGAHASQMNKDERWKVAMFVRTLQHGDFNLEGLKGGTTEVADTTAGEVVSTEAGLALFGSMGCTACHNETQKTVGPSLVDIAKAYANNNAGLSSFLKGEGEAIVDPAMFSVMQGQLAATQGLSDADLTELVNYINSIK